MTARELKIPGDRKFYLDFESAFANFAPYPIPQFIFTVEVTLRWRDIGEQILDEALDSMRELGAAEIVSCEALGGQDKRRI